MAASTMCFTLCASGWDTKTTLHPMPPLQRDSKPPAPVLISQRSSSSAQSNLPALDHSFASPELTLESSESFFGFVKEPIDAAILAEAASIDLVPLTQACDVHVRSGSVFIMTVDDALKWNDGMMWSPAIAVGRFMLSRQVEQMQCGHVDNSLMHDQSNSEVSLVQGTQLVENGLCKRSITVKSTRGYRFHIVSYFNHVDILHLYSPSPENNININSAEPLKPPSVMPQFQDILKYLIRLICSTRHTPELIALPPSVIPFEDSTDGDTDYDSDDNPISPLLLPSSFIAV